MTGIRALIVCFLAAGPSLAQEDVADVPAQDLRAGGDAQKRYFLIGPKPGAAPAGGYGLVIITPGGDGSAEFHPFIKRIFKHALPDGYIAAQPVAVKWTADQQIVWPTAKSRVPQQKFTTEQFVHAVIDDVKAKHKLDEQRILTLTWSSSGPAAYAIALQAKTPVTGSFIAMSVFHPKSLPPLKGAKGRPFYLYHSPDDQLCPMRMAEDAAAVLAEAGAMTTLVEYGGGHGWRSGDVFGDIHRGIAWLEQNVGKIPEGFTETKARPASYGLISNGGFEQRTAGWIIGNNSRRLKLTPDAQEKAEGGQSLRISKTGGVPVDIMRVDVPRPPRGKKVNVSAMVKAQDARNAWLKFFIWDAQGNVLVEDLDIGRITGTFDWKKMEKTFAIPTSATKAAVQFWMVLDGTVWIDDVRVEATE
jgi:predicted esterase